MKASGSRLEAITKELHLQWQQTKEHWADAKSLEFEQRFLSDLITTVDRAAPVFDDLEKVLSRVRNDCE